MKLPNLHLMSINISTIQKLILSYKKELEKWNSFRGEEITFNKPRWWAVALFFWVLAIYHIHKPLSKLPQNNNQSIFLIEIKKRFRIYSSMHPKLKNQRIGKDLRKRKKKVTSSSISLIFCIIVDMVAVTAEQRERAHGGSVEVRA